MTKKYLTLDYLPILLRFIIDEHLEATYGEKFIDGECEKIAQELYDKAAEALWGGVKVKPKDSRRPYEDESTRMEMAVDLMNREKISFNAAATLIAEKHPVNGITTSTLVKRIERQYNEKRPLGRKQGPVFIHTTKPSKLDINLLEKHGKEQWNKEAVQDILSRIRDRLIQP